MLGLAGSLAEFLDDGLLEQVGASYQLTSVGRVLARVVAMTFDGYLQSPTEAGLRYSRTV